MFADLCMQVLAVKPSSKNTFIRVVFVHLVSWNLTINSGIQFVVSVCMHRDFCTRAIRSVAETCLQMTRICKFCSQAILKDTFIRVVTWAKSLFKHDIYSGFQIVGVGAQTHVYGPIDQLPSHVCWFVYARLGSQTILKEYFHSSCYFEHCMLDLTALQWLSNRGVGAQTQA